MDRRIQRTRQAIMEAFIGLVEELGFEKITIQAIADRANVNRGTIYLHFADKYALLDECVETYLQLLYDSCMPDGEPDRDQSRALLLRTFEFLERHAAIYSTLMTSKGVPAFRKKMISLMEQGILEHVQRVQVHTNVKKDVLIQFLSLSVAGLVEWWVVQSMPYTPAEMTDQLMIILEHNLLSLGQFQGADSPFYNK